MEFYNYDFDSATPEYHSSFSISYGELCDKGLITWGENGWNWNAFNDEQKERIIAQMYRKFYSFEINAFPFKIWKMNFLQCLEETQAKLNYWYKVYDDINPLYKVDEWEKKREVTSDFPQALLSDSNADYVSGGKDYERETIKNENLMEMLSSLKTFKDVDETFLSIVENKCFTCLGTLKFNSIY